MRKQKQLRIVLIFILIAAIFFLRGFIKNPEAKPKETIISETIPAEPLPESFLHVIEKYDSLISSEVKQTNAVGAAIAVVHKNQVAFLKCFGVKKVGSNDSINSKTIFRLASVSKTISGTLAGILDDEKIIDLNDRVVDYLPSVQLKEKTSTENLTIGNLLDHTSGLVPHAYDNLVEDYVSLKKITQRLNEVDISAEPGKLYGYQNVMFSLFDPIVQSSTKQSFSKVLKQKVFTPFNMEMASTGFNAFKHNPNKALPHYGSNGHYRTIKLNNRYYSTAPAAGVNASISDMSQFLIHLLDTSYETISKHARETIFTPRIYTPLPRRYLSKWGKVDSRHYGIGWRIIGYRGRKIAYHGGYVTGYRAEIALCEEENIGVVFLCNSPNSVGSIVVPSFLNLVFDAEENEIPFHPES